MLKKKIAIWCKKSTDEEKNLLLLFLKKTLSLRTQKRPSLRTLKRMLSIRNLMRKLITVKPKDHAINADHQELQDPQWLSRCKLTLGDFLVVVYDRVDDGDTFSKKNLVLEGFVFMLPVIKKLKLKYFSRKR